MKLRVKTDVIKGGEARSRRTTTPESCDVIGRVVSKRSDSTHGDAIGRL